MIANDAVDAIGRLAERFGDADMQTILVGLGLAPDEGVRMMMVAKWSVERVERSLLLMTLDGLPAMREMGPACWLDGFAIGLAMGLGERPTI